MTEIPKVAEVIFKLFSWTWWITHHERYMEIKGIVDAVDDPSITMSKAILINSLYELQAWCTSIVAQQADGKIVHSRNLDFDFADYMRNITFRAVFTKNGQYVYDAVMFGGTIGVYTGMKAGAFSLSENQRWPQSNVFGLVQNLFMLSTGFQEISWVTRVALENCKDYQCAYRYLKSVPISSLGYIILAGVESDQGSIISRNRYNAAHIDTLDNSTGKWFIVQTNNDHWKDHGCYNRCAAATEHMNAVTQERVNVD